MRETLSVASRTPPPGDLACTPGMCPELGINLNQELNWGPSALRDNAEPTEPHQPKHRPVVSVGGQSNVISQCQSNVGFLSDSRCYCFECVDVLVGPGTSEKVHAMSNWVCFLCLPSSRTGLLQRRRKWRERLKAFYDQEAVSSHAEA